MPKPVVFGFVLLQLFLVNGCRQISHHEGVKNGMIEYRISYLNDNLSGKLEELLPRNMELVFDQDQAVNFIDGFLGMYSFNTVTDFTTRRCSTLLKVFDKSYVYHGRRGELMCCFDPMEDMMIEVTDDTCVIAGFSCRRAIASFPSGEEAFEVYFTNDIDLRHPNLNNPYKDIDGVLIRFELQLFHLRMEFIAEEFTPQSGRQLKHTEQNASTEVNSEQMAQLLRKLLD